MYAVGRIRRFELRRHPATLFHAGLIPTRDIGEFSTQYGGQIVSR